MGGCCGGHKRTAANTFYDDGDNREPKPPKPERTVSRVSVFYNDGDEVKEEKTSCSCWGTSSKTKPKKSSKRASNKAGKKGKRKKKKGRRNKTRRPSSTMSTASTLSRVGHEDTNGKQRLNQVVPQSRSFYRNDERVTKALARRKTMQRAMNEAYDTKSVSSTSSEESEDERKSSKKKSTSCFAGLSCKSDNTVANNFHNQ